MFSPNAFNLLAEIKPEKKIVLQSLLEEISARPDDNPWWRFPGMTGIHFGRILILDEVLANGTQKYPAYLVLSTNYDDSLALHLQEMAEKGGQGLDAMMACCQNYQAESYTIGQRVAFLRKHGHFRPYFYRGTWYKRVAQIRREALFCQRAQDLLDQPECQDQDAETLRDVLCSRLKSEPDFELFPLPEREKLSFLQYLKVLGILQIILLVLIPFLIILRIYEALDRQIAKKAKPLRHTQKMVQVEDLHTQNQVTHIVEVKEGWFRQFTLRQVLAGVDWLARYFYNQGKLGGIPTIHFARWILIDGGKRLLFFSNYDGSWESYLGDFVDKAAIGLTGVWSNTKGFPDTRFLLFGGAADEQRFKVWAREHQVYTHVWYSAYPDLTLANIQNNHAIYQGLCEGEKLNKAAILTWLAKF